MDLQTLISPEEARAELVQYERQIAEERTAEDVRIRTAYRAAARGLKVISLPQAIQAGGFHDSGMPRIAVVRADAHRCFANWDGRDMVFADDYITNQNDHPRNRGALVGEHTVRVPLEPPHVRKGHTSRWNAAVAIVPSIPPRYRPKIRRLRGFHILWEAEWTRVPPKDPALIRWIRGDLWAVHAVWDLTELERAVLSSR
jgi:hypothetical protein